MTEEDKSRQRESQPGWAGTLLGAVAGAVAAVVVGFGLSAAFSAVGPALVAPSEGAHQSARTFLARAGLNLYAIHHIRIAGGGLPGGPSGAYVSIAWPITTWAILPAAALAIGGWLSGRLSGARGRHRFWVGLLSAVPYVIILLAVRGLFGLHTSALRFPLPKIAGVELEPGLLSALLRPAAGSTLFHGLLFGAIFGSIGALGGLRAIWRGLVRRDAFWPSWLRGAVVAVVLGQLIFVALLAAVSGRAMGAFSRGGKNTAPGELARGWVTNLAASAGWAYYLAHGVTLRADTAVAPGVPEAEPVVQRYRVGLLTGIVEDDKRKPAPHWAYLLLIVPAAALVTGGFLAAKTAGQPASRPALAAGFAAAYALLLTALVPCYTLALRTVITTQGLTNRTTASIGPSAAQVFALGLILAFVFGFIGVSVYRPYARS